MSSPKKTAGAFAPAVFLLPAEVIHSALEHFLVFVAVYVAVQGTIVPFAVAHFTKYTAVCGGNALNGTGGAVGVKAVKCGLDR